VQLVLLQCGLAESSWFSGNVSNSFYVCCVLKQVGEELLVCVFVWVGVLALLRQLTIMLCISVCI